MRLVMLACTAVIASSPAAAVTCEDFLNNFDESDGQRGDILPPLEVTKESYSPLGYSITNLANIDGSISCEGGALEGRFLGIGASLSSGTTPDFDRWALLILAISDAITIPTGVLEKLQDEATNNAERERIKSGLFVGGAEADIGQTSITFTVMSGQLEFGVSLNPQ